MTTEHPNAVTGRRLWEATAEGSAEAIRELLADDVIWRAPGRNLLSGEYHGPEGVVDYFARVGELSDDIRLTLRGVYAGQEGAVLAYHASVRRGVKRMEMDFLLRLDVRAGKIIDAASVPVDQPENDQFWS